LQKAAARVHRREPASNAGNSRARDDRGTRNAAPAITLMVNAVLPLAGGDGLVIGVIE
jgi:hypothetical protein